MNSCISCSGELIWKTGGGMSLLCQLHFLHQLFNFLNLIRLTWVLAWRSCVQSSCLRIFLYNIFLVSGWHIIKIAASQRSFSYLILLFFQEKKYSIYLVVWVWQFLRKMFSLLLHTHFQMRLLFPVFLKVDFFLLTLE